MIRTHVLICGGTGCSSSGSMRIGTELEAEIALKGLSNEVQVVRTGCFGLCENGPIMVIYPDGIFYNHVTVEDVPQIVEETLLKGRVIDRLLHKDADGNQVLQEPAARGAAQLRRHQPREH